MQINVRSFELILKNWFFRVEVEENGKPNCHFLSRYSELLDVHELFRKDNKRTNVPEFPPKSFFGSPDVKFMEQRKKGLETYFANVIKYKDQLRYNMKAWNEFIEQKRAEEAMLASSGQQTPGSLRREDSVPESPKPQLTAQESKKEREEALFEQFSRQLVFLEVKTLNKTNFKRKNVSVEPAEVSAGVVVTDAKELEERGVSEVVAEAVALATDVESLLYQENEMQKKVFFQEFYYPLKFTPTVAN